ncbi:hypothetical protein [Methylogaea oryzae]|uniref:hypothetical protein n=1 Tax=Methylogaea oryzae TaxID=1295382 RepID=UPI000A6661B2|nr:hypothetical protein [Methylogaea oryzae]
MLDAEILADVYLAMTGGQMALLEEPEAGAAETAAESMSTQRRHTARPPLRVLRCTPEELAAHEERLAALQKSSGGNCLWSEPTA